MWKRPVYHMTLAMFEHHNDASYDAILLCTCADAKPFVKE